MRSILEGNLALLTEDIEQVFDLLFTEYEGNEGALNDLRAKQALLHACEERGVEVVFDALARERVEPGKEAIEEQD